MLLRTLVLVWSLVLTGCAAIAVAPNTNEIDARLARLQDRLAALQLAGVDSESYAIAEARAWFELAFDAHAQGDRGAVIEQAVAQSESILRRVECCSETIHVQAPVQIAGMNKVRPDLWARLSALQQHAHFGCAQGDIARLRIQLITAGIAYSDLGWRHARPYIAAAERYVRSAERRTEVCFESRLGVSAAHVAGEQTSAPAQTVLLPSALGKQEARGRPSSDAGFEEKSFSSTVHKIDWQ